MQEYSALVSDAGRVVFVEHQEYSSKADFIHDLRRNGYWVNPCRVKRSDVFDYIVAHTNMNFWDWDIKNVPDGF